MQRDIDRANETRPQDRGNNRRIPVTKHFLSRAAVFSLVLLHTLDAYSEQAAETAAAKPAVVFTTQQDQQNILEQLGITKLRPGRSPNADSPNAANYDEAKANPYPNLPEALKTAAGEAVDTPELWRTKRRGEIVELLESEVYGRVPQNVPKVKWEVRQTRDIEAGGKPAIQKEIVGVVDNSACPEIQVNISLSLTLPKDAKGPVPVLMSFGFTPFDAQRFNFGGAGRRGGPGGGGPRPPSKQDKLIAAGWACAMLNPSTVQDDSGGWQARRFGPPADPNAKPTGAGLTRGIIGLTNLGQPRKPDQWGALRAWGWGASRALDYLETVPEVDAKRVGIAGVSRYGKAALVAMAFDERFAMGLIASSGAGGTKLYRRNFGESLENLASSGAYHWMAGNYIKYSAEESSFGRRTAADLPVDSHMTLALCAPRLTFISHGVPERGDAHWLDHQGSFMAAIAAQPVFRLLGARDLGRSDDYMKERMPDVNVDLLEGALAWRQHDGGHTDEPNVEHFIRWAQAQSGVAQPRESQPQEKTDEAGKHDAGQQSANRDRRSLREAVGGRFKIGVGVSHVVVQNPEDAVLIRQHFGVVTPENCMKPQSIQPAENEWNFEAADRFADFARGAKLEVVGHCLVWAKDDRTDPWMMQEDGKPVSRETLLRRIEAHVAKVVERYADVATEWDVVNEAVGDSGDGLLRDSVYSRTTGIDFIVTAFKAARAKDPDALLIYNDYNDHLPGKRKKVIELLTQLKQKGAPVDAYGMQGHFELGDDSIAQLRETFDALRKLGLKVVVSELDIDVVTRGRWWADGGKYRDELATYDPYRDGLPAEIVQKQARQYAELFELFIENSDIIERVSFWNLHDGQSWLNYFPWRRVNHPLLFDRNRRPKPAFDAVYETLQNQPAAHAAIERRDANSRIAHEQLLQKTKQGRIDVYFQGDSITRRWGATDYPKFLAHWKESFHGWNAANFAWGGDNTHNILWRMQNGELDGVSPKVIVLQAGANNLPSRGPADDEKVDEVYSGIRAIVDEFRKRAPEATIVLTAVFPRTQNMQLAPTIKKINERIETLADGKRVRFLNINDRLADSSGRLLPGISSDGLHLEKPGYEIWAEALKPILEELLGPPAKEDQAPPPTGDPRAAR
jgi:GH35 family endo-1,4-beta-xylanase/lysophospholipase L1-like esterase